MKQYILPSVLMFLGLSLIVYGCATNTKPVPEQTVNNCPYEGLECPNAERYARDYQLELLSDSTQIWDGERLVATVHYSASIDSVLLLDNQ